MLAFMLMAFGALLGAIIGSTLAPHGLMGLVCGLFLGGIVGFALGRLASAAVKVITRFIFWAFVGACVGGVLGWAAGLVLDASGSASIRLGALAGALLLMITRGGRGRGGRLASSDSPAHPPSTTP